MDSIEIILKKDSQGNDIDLASMSLDTSKSLRQILDALIAIVEYEKDLHLKIGLERGSVAEKILGNAPNLKVVYNKMVEASEAHTKRDNIYVRNLNVLYDNFHKVEEYEMFYNADGHKKDLKPLFSNKFRKSRTKKKIENNFNVEFITGVLQQNGGKKPNFHLITAGEPITIQCEIEEAIKVNKFLYKEINVAAWAKATPRGMNYQFCDLYVDNSEQYFTDFKQFFKSLKTMEGTEPFHAISEKLESFYDIKDYAGARKFMRIFLTPLSIPTYLRTILVISKAFKEDDYFETTLSKVEALLSQKIGKVY